MSLNLPATPPRSKIELARFSTPHGVLELPTDPSLIIWHVSTEARPDGHLRHRISGDPSAFEKDTSAQAFPSLEAAIRYTADTAPSPAPGISTLSPFTCDRGALVRETIDPVLNTPAAQLSLPAASALRQYLLDTGPIKVAFSWERSRIIKAYPSFFYTKSASDNLLAARPFKSKSKPKPAAPSPASATAPSDTTPDTPPPSKPTPLERHAALRHLPAVNITENKARREWMLARGAIPIPYHRAFFNTFRPLIQPPLFRTGQSWSASPRKHPLPFNHHYLEQPSVNSSAIPQPITKLAGKDDCYPAWHDFDSNQRAYSCCQSEPDYAEEIRFFSSLNERVYLFIDVLLNPDFQFTACPTYRPHLRTPRFPNPFIHFLFRYHRLAVARALSYYSSYLHGLTQAPPPVEDRISASTLAIYIARNRRMAASLIRLQRVMGFRTYPDQSTYATHLSAEELDSL